MPINKPLKFVAESREHVTLQPYHIVIGITHPQTCLTLTGRLRALRNAGFRVTLISSPGELLDRTAAREGVEAIGLAMRREIAPFADVVSLLRLWWLLLRLRPDVRIGDGHGHQAFYSANGRTNGSRLRTVRTLQ